MTNEEYTRKIICIINEIYESLPKIEEIQEIKRKKYKEGLALLGKALFTMGNSLGS